MWVSTFQASFAPPRKGEPISPKGGYLLDSACFHLQPVTQTTFLRGVCPVFQNRQFDPFRHAAFARALTKIYETRGTPAFGWSAVPITDPVIAMCGAPSNVIEPPHEVEPFYR